MRVPPRNVTISAPMNPIATLMTRPAARGAPARPLSNDRDDHSPKTAPEEDITGGHPVHGEFVNPRINASGAGSLVRYRHRATVGIVHGQEWLSGRTTALSKKDEVLDLPEKICSWVPVAVESAAARKAQRSFAEWVRPGGSIPAERQGLPCPPYQAAVRTPQGQASGSQARPRPINGRPRLSSAPRPSGSADRPSSSGCRG